MRGPIRLGLAAALLAVGLLGFGSNPASGVVPVDVDGTITIGSNVYDVGGAGGGGGGGGGEPAPCPGSEDLDVTFGTGTWSASGTFVAPFQVGGSANWYQASISILFGSGSVTGSSPSYSLDGQVIWEALLQQVDPTTCATTTLCTVRALTEVVSPSAHTGTLPSPATGDVTELFGDSSVGSGVPIVAVGGSCGVTLSGALVGQHIFADLDLTW